MSLTGLTINESIVAFRKWLIDTGSGFLKLETQVPSTADRSNRATGTVRVTRENSNFYVILGVNNRNTNAHISKGIIQSDHSDLLFSLSVLVFWLDIFVLLGKVNPELHTFNRLSLSWVWIEDRHFGVGDTPTGRHPLNISGCQTKVTV